MNGKKTVHGLTHTKYVFKESIFSHLFSILAEKNHIPIMGKPALKTRPRRTRCKAEEEELRSQENERLGSAVESMQEAWIFFWDEGIPKL